MKPREMLSKLSVRAHMLFLTILAVVFAFVIILFQVDENRTVALLGDQLTNYHRHTILACGQVERDLFRFQSNVLSAPQVPPKNSAVFSEPELRVLLESQVDIIATNQRRYNTPAFERTARNVIDAHITLEDLLSTRTMSSQRDGILQSDAWAIFRLRVLQLKRLHSAKSEEVSAELQTVHVQTFQNILMLTVVMLLASGIVTLRIMKLIRAAWIEQNATSDALRESHDRTQAILDSTVEAIITIDERGLIEAFNNAAEKTFGYAALDVMGKNISILMPEPYRSGHDDYLRNYFATGIKKIIGSTQEVEGRRKDGTAFPIEISVSEVNLDGRRIFTGVILDISSRKNLEDQLRQSQKMEAVGRLAGGVAHDFNNILTVIQGYAGVLNEDSQITAESREFLDEILQAATRAQELTTQLLAFSRKQVLQPKLIDLNDIVDRDKKMLARLIGEHIELVTDLDPALAIVKADPGQIEQIILNLAVNARDAMPDGGTLTIKTANVHLDESNTHLDTPAVAGSYCMLAVSDTGIGMDKETRDYLFEPFFTTKDSGKGTGLGLSMVYGIVQQSGGHIGVHSEPNKGAIFEVYFKASSQEEYLAPQAKTASPQTARRGNETVLVVEDDEKVRKFVLRILTDHGYQTLGAESPEVALTLFYDRADSIDIVVTDVIMPGMSGRELAQRISKSHSDTAILFMSGYTDDEIGRHGVLEEGVNFIQKPFTPEDFVEKVRKVLDGRTTVSETLPEQK